MSKKLDVGCGRDYDRSYEGLDSVDFGQEYIWDITKTPFCDKDGKHLPSESYNEIHCFNTMEHIPVKDVILVMNEFYRLLADHGVLDMLVPQFGTPNSVADPTHKAMWDYIEGDGVNFFAFWNEDSPKTKWDRRSFDYWAGKRPRNADYEFKKWAIENDGKGNYTWELTPSTIHVRLVKGKQL